MCRWIHKERGMIVTKVCMNNPAMLCHAAGLLSLSSWCVVAVWWTCQRWSQPHTTRTGTTGTQSQCAGSGRWVCQNQDSWPALSKWVYTGCWFVRLGMAVNMAIQTRCSHRARTCDVGCSSKGLKAAVGDRCTAGVTPVVDRCVPTAGVTPVVDRCVLKCMNNVHSVVLIAPLSMMQGARRRHYALSAADLA
jgi:hypothetical protein